MNNKGFSLIELLIAIAVGTVILLMLSFMLVQGTSMFRTENDEINVSNDYQVVRNQISQVIMEAKSLTIVKEQNGDIVVYTGEVDLTTNKLSAEGDDSVENTVTTERVLTFDKSEGKIYISNSYGTATAEGNIVCNIVTNFDISVNPDCLKVVSDGAVTESYYVNPLNVNIVLELSGESNDVDTTMSVRVRNILREVSVYKTEVSGQLLVNVTDVETVKVK